MGVAPSERGDTRLGGRAGRESGRRARERGPAPCAGRPLRPADGGAEEGPAGRGEDRRRHGVRRRATVSSFGARPTRLRPRTGFSGGGHFSTMRRMASTTAESAGPSVPHRPPSGVVRRPVAIPSIAVGAQEGLDRDVPVPDLANDGAEDLLRRGPAPS